MLLSLQPLTVWCPVALRVQIILTGPAWSVMSEQMPDETRPIDLGTYALVKYAQPLQLMEVQVRQLQERKFPPLPQNLKKTPGYHDAPECDDGIAYLMCKVLACHTPAANRPATHHTTQRRPPRPSTDPYARTLDS